MKIHFNPFYILIHSEWITGLTLTAKFPFIHCHGNWGAKAFWPFIFHRKGISRTTLEHEKIHLRQQLRGWLIWFYIKYAWYHYKLGYYDNPYEVEAYAHQDDWKKSQQL